jgi:hypothetical protein
VAAAPIQAAINMVQKMVAKVEPPGSQSSSELDGLFSHMSSPICWQILLVRHCRRREVVNCADVRHGVLLRTGCNRHRLRNRVVGLLPF